MLPAYAHVRWFVDTATVTIEPYRLNEPIVLGVIMLSLIGLVIATLLQPLEQRWWQRLVVSAQVIRVSRWIGFAMVVVGVWLAHNWIELLPYLGYISYVALIRRYPRLALGILAAGVGVSFALLGFDEKLLHPELAATFLFDHPWTMGLPVRLFIFGAGMVEVTLGLFMTFGLAARLSGIIILVTMAVTAIALGWAEVLGHLPIAAAVVMYLLESTKIKTWSARLQT